MANQLKMAIIQSILQLRALRWSQRRIARERKRPARAYVAAASTGRGGSLESQRPRWAARRRARRWRTAAALRRCSSRR
jgi:hypothetical protein